MQPEAQCKHSYSDVTAKRRVDGRPHTDVRTPDEATNILALGNMALATWMHQKPIPPAPLMRSLAWPVAQQSARPRCIIGITISTERVEISDILCLFQQPPPPVPIVVATVGYLLGRYDSVESRRLQQHHQLQGRTMGHDLQCSAYIRIMWSFITPTLAAGTCMTESSLQSTNVNVTSLRVHSTCGAHLLLSALCPWTS